MNTRNKRFAAIGAALAAVLVSGAALAQEGTVQADTQRDVNQQNRIEQGLQSGQLSTKEAGQLERQEKHVDNIQARDLKNGSVSPAEQQRLNAAQSRVSQDVYADKHNGVTGNPDSKSSRRMQADVQRNANQEQRISNGERSSQLSGRQVGKLERGQAHDDAKQSAADANGHITRDEQNSINRSDNRQSDHVHDDRGGY